MFYLFLAILSSSTIAFIFKFAENRAFNPYVIMTGNYFLASLISLFLVLQNNLLTNLKAGLSFQTEWSLVVRQGQGLFSLFNSVLWGLIVGGIAGFFFFFSFFYYQKSVQENGVGLSGSFSKLGILIPMIFSIVLWREFPTAIQWLGIGLSLIAILMVNLSLDSIKAFKWNGTILLLFFLGGLAEFSNKIYQQYALNSYKDIFLLAVFLVAFLISFFYTQKNHIQWTKKEALTGLILGIPNLFSSYFLIMSLETLATSVAFPLFSAGSIVLINLGGFFIFQERITQKNKLAIILVLIALLLINSGR